jgi:hypothetical protein
VRLDPAQRNRLLLLLLLLMMMMMTLAGSRRAGASSRNAYEAILCYEACTPALRRASKVLFRPRVHSTPADWRSRRSVVQQCFLSGTFAYEGILGRSIVSDRRWTCTTGRKDECTV